MIETGVLFGNIHSYHDLNLILAPFTPTPAKPKTDYIDIPGGDGSIDATEANGRVVFDDREFTLLFTVSPKDKMTFDEKVSQVSNALNGLKCKITFDRDSEFYWDGRCVVDSFAQDRRLKQITIKLRVRPYKYKRWMTVHSFALTEAEKIITLTNGKKPIVPEITCTNDGVKVVFGDGTYTLSAGTHKYLDIYLNKRNNILK